MSGNPQIVEDEWENDDWNILVDSNQTWKAIANPQSQIGGLYGSLKFWAFQPPFEYIVVDITCYTLW